MIHMELQLVADVRFMKNYLAKGNLIWNLENK